MKPLIIFHAHCTDGFAAVFSAWLKFGDFAEYYPASYGEKAWSGLFEDYPQGGSKFDGRDVYILDFSFSAQQMQTIMASASKTVWLDHHKSAFENWCGMDYLTPERQLYDAEDEYLKSTIVLDNNKSGALLAWEYFHPDKEVPDMIKWVDDRDRWQFKYSESEAFHAGMASLKPWTFKQWEEILLNDNFLLSLIVRGSAILTAKEQEVKSLAKHARKVVINPQETSFEDRTYPDNPKVYSGLAVNSPLHMSEIGHELANESGAYGLIWYLGKENKAKISLRSNGDYDVSEIAKLFKGGGHKNAAGFEVTIETLLGWMA